MTTPVLPFLIGGAEVPGTSGRAGDVFDPALGQVIRRVSFAGPSDVDRAVAAARAALPAWRETPPLRRARILARYRELLEAHRAELTRLITEEHGKTLPDAAGSLQRGIEVVEFAEGIPHLLKGEHS
ncbi:MAG: aldehyde dehydrogenase family protein, partial [Acidobacteriota bacterium]